MTKSWKCHLKQWVRCLWQSSSAHIETTLSVDIAMIKNLLSLEALTTVSVLYLW